MNRKTLLIADDSEMNRAMLVNMLGHDFQIMEASDGREALTVLEMCRGEISLLLLDVVMPEVDGFAVLEEMGRRQWIEDVPTIMISAETGGAYIDRAFDLGASDYISRPFAAGIIRRRVINTILLHTRKQQLADMMAGRFFRRERKLEEMLAVLNYAVEYRCGEGGRHTGCVCRVTKLLLQRLLERESGHRLDPIDVDAVAMAAGLHDIGKLMIPEELLKKPGPLTEAERAIVRQHTRIGARIISGLPVYRDEKLTKYAIEICRWHHERWNGEGYPDGLKGDRIPLAAQVAGLADAYDALISRRSGRAALSHQQAMERIRSGACGSFSPLLLSCLDDMSDVIRQGAAERENPKLYAMRHIESELYQSQDLAAVRMTQQLEEAYAKQDFFSSLSEEIWFEYTTSPSALHLSQGAMNRTGLPAVIVELLENPDFLTLVGEETVCRLRQELGKLTPGETYMELPATLVLDGQPRRCQLAVLVTWSPLEHRQYISLMGRATDIDDRCRRLEDYDETVGAAAVEEQLLIPVTAHRDDVLRITGDQIGAVMQGYRRMFTSVRLVDPDICLQVNADDAGHAIDRVERCYGVWKKAQRCERCISQDAVRTRSTRHKVETVGNDIYYVTAMCVEIDGILYALECLSLIRSGDMQTSGDQSLLNQLLVRNRQVYTDSATRAFNRRYYDDRLRGLTGTYALAMMDIDRFKEINDRFGHPAGDAALYAIAQAVRSQLRGSDELVRYGGDEFLLLFHELPEHMLERKLRDIVKTVEELRMPEYPALRLTLSIGGVYGEARIDQLVKMADTALYQAKRTRNCTVLYKEEDDHDTD